MHYLLSVCLLLSFIFNSFADEPVIWSVRNVSYTDVAHKTVTVVTKGVILKADVKFTLKENSYLLIGTQSPFAFIEVKKAGVYLFKDLWLKKNSIADSLIQHATGAYQIITNTYKDPYGMNRPGTVYRFGPEKMKLWYMNGDVELKTLVLANKTYTLHWEALSESFKTPKVDIKNLFGDLLSEPVADPNQSISFNFRKIEKNENQIIITWTTDNEQDDPFERMFMVNNSSLIYPAVIEKSIVSAGNSDFSLLIAAEYCKSKNYFIDAVDYYIRVKETALIQYLSK